MLHFIKMREDEWSIQDTNVTHERGVLYSFCTFADLEEDLPSYVFVVVHGTSVYSEAETSQQCTVEQQECESRVDCSCFTRWIYIFALKG